ncbi:MAG: hypothetical protein LBI18_15230 [Planctomycetaceae bacterium]|jgi:hypothetical protein|nr:hypothetical protein [Planctomycetaceae bacterium]
MPHQRGYMPKKDSDFIAWASTIYNDCAQSATQWQINPNSIQLFESLLNEAKNAFEHNSNKELKNKATVVLKNATFVALKHFLSAFVNTLEGNLNVPDEAITAMSLRPRHPHARQPLPVPNDAPMLTAVVGQHHDVTVYVRSLLHGHPTEQLNNRKYAGFLLKYKLDPNEQWQFLVSTKLHHNLLFNNEDKGKNLHLQAAWVNPRMQNGPWSEELEELVN